jgi:organic radical activating enzyme
MFDLLVFCPTNYCNAECRFCATSPVHNRKLERHVSVQEAKKIIRIAIKLGCREIRITGGGEPTSRFNDLINVINFAKSTGMKITLITNASYAENEKKTLESTSDMVKAGLDRIFFSFDWDHLFFIPYENYLRAIKEALNSGLEINIFCVDRKATKERNTKYLKKLAKDLNGKYKVPLFRIRHNILNKKMFGEKNWILLENDIIEVSRNGVEYSGLAKKLRGEFDFKNSEKLIFDIVLCSIKKILGNETIVVNYDGKIILNCCFFENCFNYTINNLEKKLNEDKATLEKISSNFGFLSIFLSIKNLEHKTGKKLLKNAYPTKCALCADMLKPLKSHKLEDPPTIQLFFFVLTHIDQVILKFLYDILIRLTVKT